MNSKKAKKARQRILCVKEGCGKRGKYNPVLRLRPPKLANETRFMELPIKMNLCKAHKEATKLEDLVTDEEWARLLQRFRAMGKTEPERTRTELNFKRIKGSL